MWKNKKRLCTTCYITILKKTNNKQNLFIKFGRDEVHIFSIFINYNNHWIYLCHRYKHIYIIIIIMYMYRYIFKYSWTFTLCLTIVKFFICHFSLFWFYTFLLFWNRAMENWKLSVKLLGRIYLIHNWLFFDSSSSVRHSFYWICPPQFPQLQIFRAENKKFLLRFLPFLLILPEASPPSLHCTTPLLSCSNLPSFLPPHFLRSVCFLPSSTLSFPLFALRSGVIDNNLFKQ